MKNIKKLLGLLTIALMVFSCTDDYDEVIQVSGEAGFQVNVTSQSSGSLLGSPESGVDLADAAVAVSDSELDLNVVLTTGDLSTVSKVEVTKQINDGPIIVVNESTTLPLNVTLNTVADFLQGSGLAESDLRIGDVVRFVVKVTKTDGQVFLFNNQGRFSLTLNCSYDLTGTYFVTNSACDNTANNGGIPLINISQNADGTWYAETSDGGLLQYCTSNNILNDGSFDIFCEGVVSAESTEGGSAYGTYSGGAIGYITGGSWDQASGVLVLELLDEFFGVGAYSATYTRQ